MAREGGGISDGVSKKNVPTMGGLLIVAAVDLSALMWAAMEPVGDAHAAFDAGSMFAGFLR